MILALKKTKVNRESQNIFHDLLKTFEISKIAALRAENGPSEVESSMYQKLVRIFFILKLQNPDFRIDFDVAVTSRLFELE